MVTIYDKGGKNTVMILGELQFPHCDPRILHEPGKCTFCDQSGLQEIRAQWNIAFTGENNTAKSSCPADLSRTPAQYHAWSGNRPVAASNNSYLQKIEAATAQSNSTDDLCEDCDETVEDCDCEDCEVCGADNEEECSYDENEDEQDSVLTGEPLLQLFAKAGYRWEPNTTRNFGKRSLDTSKWMVLTVESIACATDVYFRQHVGIDEDDPVHPRDNHTVQMYNSPIVRRI